MKWMVFSDTIDGGAAHPMVNRANVLSGKTNYVMTVI